MEQAGGKGASLGEMTQAGIPVPPGFVVLSSAFDRFISEANIKADIDSILHKVNHQEMESVESASEEIQAIILSQEINRALEGIRFRLGTSPREKAIWLIIYRYYVKAHLDKDVAGKLGGSAIARINNYF